MLQITYYRPQGGLVGGHCIPVDPYYLVYKAKALGYHPQVILAGRAINDYMPKHVAEMAIKCLNETFLQAKTFTKNAYAFFLLRKRKISLVKFLKLFKRKVCYDHLLSKEEIKGFGVNALDNLDMKIKMEGVIVAVAHDEFKNKSFLSTGSFFRKKV